MRTLWCVAPAFDYQAWRISPLHAAYDNEGEMASMTYAMVLGGSNKVVGGGLYTYGYDSVTRMSSMTGSTNAPASVSNATYRPAGELLSMAGMVNEHGRTTTGCN